jgi:hypothetical protein
MQLFHHQPPISSAAAAAAAASLHCTADAWQACDLAHAPLATQSSRHRQQLRPTSRQPPRPLYPKHATISFVNHLFSLLLLLLLHCLQMRGRL